MLKNDVSLPLLLYPRFGHIRQSVILSSPSIGKKGDLRRQSKTKVPREAMAPKSDMKMNAIRSGIVVMGALAFGYLSIQIGFKPFLEEAQQQNALHQSDSDSSSPSQQSAFPQRDS